MPSDREQRRTERRARIAARRLRVQARRERVQSRREAMAAKREAMALPPGLRRVEHIATEVGTPPRQVALTRPGTQRLNIAYLQVSKVQSSWVEYVILVDDQTTGQRRLGVRFLDEYACMYLASSEADYHAMLAAPSKGKHIWSHWYGMGRRVFTDDFRRYLAGD